MTAWNKAAPARHAEFLRKAGLRRRTKALRPGSRFGRSPARRQLPAEGGDAIRRFKDNRRPGNLRRAIMNLLGGRTLDPSPGMAKGRNMKPKPDVLPSLGALLGARACIR